jgi:hypothetical protein
LPLVALETALPLAEDSSAVSDGRTLLLPYAIADNATSFATVQLDRLLAAMT